MRSSHCSLSLSHTHTHTHTSHLIPLRTRRFRSRRELFRSVLVLIIACPLRVVLLLSDSRLDSCQLFTSNRAQICIRILCTAHCTTRNCKLSHANWLTISHSAIARRIDQSSVRSSTDERASAFRLFTAYGYLICGWSDVRCLLLCRLRIKRAPPVLALHLKRFKMGDGQQNRYVKLSYCVSFPFEMRLFNYVRCVFLPPLRIRTLHRTQFCSLVHHSQGTAYSPQSSLLCAYACAYVYAYAYVWLWLRSWRDRQRQTQSLVPLVISPYSIFGSR